MPSARSIAGSPAYRFQRCHPALQSGHIVTAQLKRQEPVSVFFGQSDLDGACGLHCFTMVLSIMGLSKACALSEMSHRKYGVPAAVWKVFQPTYFTGCDVEEYVELIDSLELPLNLKTVCEPNSIDQFALDNLMQGELVALAFASIKNRRTKHWALGVGVEGSAIGRTSQPDTLLLLDPSGSEPTFRTWNARLSVPQRPMRSHVSQSMKRHSKPLEWMYEAPEWPAEPVRLLAAVRFRRTTRSQR